MKLVSSTIGRNDDNNVELEVELGNEVVSHVLMFWNMLLESFSENKAPMFQFLVDGLKLNLTEVSMILVLQNVQMFFDTAFPIVFEQFLSELSTALLQIAGEKYPQVINQLAHTFTKAFICCLSLQRQAKPPRAFLDFRVLLAKMVFQNNAMNLKFIGDCFTLVASSSHEIEDREFRSKVFHVFTLFTNFQLLYSSANLMLINIHDRFKMQPAY
jgi:hypothetical protein